MSVTNSLFKLNLSPSLSVISGMKLMLICIFIFLFSSCNKDAPNTTVVTPPSSPTIHTWLALGDSYTIGQGVAANERFPMQTAALLLQQGIQVQAPTYVATTGWTTGNLQSSINSINPNKHSIVSLLIGVNDQYQFRDTTGYRQRFTELLIKAIELANGKKQNVFVLSIPDYSVTPFAASYDTAQIRKEIDWFNNINRHVTQQYNCPYLDITPSTREGRYNSSLIASDGLHPSAAEYKRWADKLTPMIVQVLK
ncbi:MAG TPA: SGNH/GDSL hydrolase family protein [Lacibacter sp.]|nr:SGNH/GDSL hydrolase family protein [Lacibacter sp.]